jgi:hypothetical protein
MQPFWQQFQEWSRTADPGPGAKGIRLYGKLHGYD